MKAPQHRDIQLAVVAWHNRHPLAARIDTSQVHSIGWVALPFMRPAQGVEPSLDAPMASAMESPVVMPQGRRAWLDKLLGRKSGGNGPAAVFSERFIDGVKPRQAAQFALRHGSSSPEPDGTGTDWPQRRIEIDSRLAERAAGAWPTELWVLSAAAEQGGRRVRVLISPDGNACLGPRLWHRAKLQGLGLLLALLVAGAAAWTWQNRFEIPSEPATPAVAGSLQVRGTVAQAASEASAPASQSAMSASGAMAASASSPSGMAASDPASAASVAASGPEPAGATVPVEAPVQAMPSASAPLVDNRPRLRSPGQVRPPVEASKAEPAASATAVEPPRERAAPGATAKPSDDAKPSKPAKEPKEARASRGSAAPESISPGQKAGAPVVALVSPALLRKADADLMLERMQSHLGQTMGSTVGLRGEVLETAEGWRAAVYPFATREEAQILNATMVARGWRTRAVTF